MTDPASLRLQQTLVGAGVLGPPYCGCVKQGVDREFAYGM